MSTGTKLITAEEFAEMHFDVPVELVRGEIVELSRPNTYHGLVCAKVSHVLQVWNSDDRFGYVISNDSGVLTGTDPDTLRGPDVYFIRHERLPSRQLPERWIEVAPDLTVEILSPHDSWNDLWEKIHEYFALGVREVWVINPRERKLHVMRPDDGPEVLDDTQTLESPEVLPGFSSPVSRLLPPALAPKAE